jgi:hypothetical protein
VGPSNFQYNNMNYENPERVAKGRHVWGMVAHSLYFTLLPELGLVGTILFFSMIICSWLVLRRISRRCRDALKSDTLPAEIRVRAQTLLQLAGAMTASLLTFLVTGAFIAVLYYPHVWLLMAFVAVLDRVSLQVLPPAADPVRAVPSARILAPSPAMAARVRR